MAINPFEQALIAMPQSGPIPEPEVPLLKNKLFLQYLAAAGQDLQAGNAIGANVSAVTNQAITAQNYKQLLQQILAGGVPGSKLTADDKGVKFDIARDSPFLKDFNPLDAEVNKNMANLSGGVGMSPSATTTPSGTGAPVSGGANRLNPFDFDLSNLTASDLAGLTPAMMGSAVELGIRARTAEAAAGVKDTSPTSIKEYEFARSQGFDKTFEDWRNKDPNSWNEYQLAKLDDVKPYRGSYTDFLKFKGESGATRITFPERLQFEEDKIDLRAEKDLGSKEFSDDIDEHMNENLVKIRVGDDPKKNWDERVTYLMQKINDSGGKMVSRKWDETEPGVVIVEVYFKSTGNTREYRYAIGEKPY